MPLLPHQKEKFVTVRDAKTSDHPFLFATYLKNNWYAKENTTTLKKEMWMALQHTRLESVLKEQTVKVACLTSDEDTILGYAFQDGSIPFTYVKLAWRSPELALSKMLAESLPLVPIKETKDEK